MSATLFKQRLHTKELLVGTFVKTPSPVICEVLGLSDLDAICLDAEHAPFGRAELDACVHALRSADKTALIRVAANSPEYIMQALDYGATGVIVPHVTSAEQAAAVVKACAFGEGGRGYAGSTRAAGYTTKPLPSHLRDSAEYVTVIIQIEDPAAVEAIDEIAAVKGIDCLFIGRIDLTVACNAATPDDDKIIKMVEKICAAGKAANTPVGMFVPRAEDVGKWAKAGANLFLLDSDHGFILKQAGELVRSLKPSS